MSKARGFLQEFQEFAVKGNMIDLAVGVIIGAAFGKIIDSLVKDIIMPLVAFVVGGEVDFTNQFWVLRAPENFSGPETYDAMRSEEHTSELQSLMRISYAVFCLKKQNKKTIK